MVDDATLLTYLIPIIAGSSSKDIAQKGCDKVALTTNNKPHTTDSVLWIG
jgi:hypothetical protein